MAEMNEASLAFWLSKFVGFKVVCNRKERVVNPVFNLTIVTFLTLENKVFIHFSNI
jgi:hypothetical protein